MKYVYLIESKLFPNQKYVGMTNNVMNASKLIILENHFIQQNLNLGY